jgi:hypothetical protein
MSDTDFEMMPAERAFHHGVQIALWNLRGRTPDPCPAPTILPGARALLTSFIRGRPELSFAIQAMAHAAWTELGGEEGHICMNNGCGGERLYVLATSDRVIVLTRADASLLSDDEERDTVENMPTKK